MNTQPNKAFREISLERAASPEQLDHLVIITRPVDWILAVLIFLALGMAVAWGFFGSLPTRAQAEGILVSSEGHVVDAVSDAAGRLASVEVAVGVPEPADESAQHQRQGDYGEDDRQVAQTALARCLPSVRHVGGSKHVRSGQRQRLHGASSLR